MAISPYAAGISQMLYQGSADLGAGIGGGIKNGVAGIMRGLQIKNAIEREDSLREAKNQREDALRTALLQEEELQRADKWHRDDVLRQDQIERAKELDRINRQRQIADRNTQIAANRDLFKGQYEATLASKNAALGPMPTDEDISGVESRILALQQRLEAMRSGDVPGAPDGGMTQDLPLMVTPIDAGMGEPVSGIDPEAASRALGLQ